MKRSRFCVSSLKKIVHHTLWYTYTHHGPTDPRTVHYTQYFISLTGACDIRVYSENLTRFIGTREDAVEAARLDNQQHEVSRIIGYKGDPLYRTSCDFLVDFPSMCERYIIDHGMDKMFVTLWGKYQTIPSDSVLVDDAFVVQHPFLLNEYYRTKYLQILQQRIHENATPPDSS